MASVRSMLRNERASRRIAHPHLTYSTTGTLICQICHIQIKTEVLWKKHLETSSHVAILRRTRDAIPDAPALVEDSNRGNGSKKRKADDDSSDDDTRKRTRGQDPPDSTVSEEPEILLADSTEVEALSVNGVQQKQPLASEGNQLQRPILDLEPKTDKNPPESPIQPSKQTNSPINEDEWAAFQREVASPPPETSAFTAAADISAAPMTAAELAAQSREEASRQAKERMEADLEGEKEDAARQMEEELDEMAELEDRVRRLREKRELLRVQRSEAKAEDIAADEEKVPPDVVKSNGSAEENEEMRDDTDDDDEDNEWGMWGR
ncbi:MAG: hypothetical protein Q9168_000471 [Polycauliona sp. 1 TL-2023]